MKYNLLNEINGINMFSTILSIIKKRFFVILFSVIAILVFIYFTVGNDTSFQSSSLPYKIRFDAFSGKEITELHLCPELSEEDYVESYGIPNSKIAIITPILNYKNYEDYIGIDTLECYANHFGYQMHLVNMTDNPRYAKLCNQTDHFFLRHCILATFLEDNKDSIEYALIIDADIGVINPCHTIQEYIDPEESVEVVFYERYYNHEISAASYFVRNSEYSRKFMHFWADYFYRLPNSFHGTDNGAIHQVFMELHFADKKQQMQCYDMWKNSHGYDDLFAYQACTKNALNISETLFVNNSIRLLRKLTPGWVRDGWLTGTKWAPQDFMFHGWKKSKLNGEWQWPFAHQFHVSDCTYKDPYFSNFKYLGKFISTNDQIMKELTRKVKDVEAAYNKTLIDRKILCKNGLIPINGICQN